MFLSNMSPRNMAYGTPGCIHIQYSGLQIDKSRQVMPRSWGLKIYLKEQYTFTERHLSDISNLWQGLFIEIQHEGLENEITLANICRPPKDNDCNAVLTKFNAMAKFALLWASCRKKALIALSGDNLTNAQNFKNISTYSSQTDCRRCKQF